jgi:sodium/proline symporter
MDLTVLMQVSVAFFILVMAYLGYRGWKRTRSLTDYTIAKGMAAPWAVGLCYAGTFCSAGTFMGVVGFAYAWGMPVLWFQMSGWFFTVMVLVLMAKGFLRMGAMRRSLSLPDWLGDRYNSDAIRVVAAGLSFFLIFYIVAQFAGLSYLWEILLGIPYRWGLLITAVVVVGYMASGGTYADIWTDVIQVILMMVVAVCIFFSVWFLFPGGFGDMTARLSSIDPVLTSTLNKKAILFASPVAIFGIFAMHMIFGTHPGLSNKILALRRERDIRTFILFAALALCVLELVVFGGLYTRALGLPVERADQATAVLLKHGFPALLGALFGVAILAASMSTTDGLFIVLSTIFSNDIFRKTLVKRNIIKYDDAAKLDRHALMVGRIVVVVVGVICVLLAFKPPEYIVVLLVAGAFFSGSGAFGPILLGVWWRRTTPKGALLGMVCGAGCYIGLYVPKIEPNVFLAGSIGAGVSLAVTAVASLLTRPLPEPFVQALFAPTEETEEAPASSQPGK